MAVEPIPMSFIDQVYSVYHAVRDIYINYAFLDTSTVDTFLSNVILPCIQLTKIRTDGFSEDVSEIEYDANV